MPPQVWGPDDTSVIDAINIQKMGSDALSLYRPRNIKGSDSSFFYFIYQ